MTTALVLISLENKILRLRLNRPDLRNSFNDQLIRELAAAFQSAEGDPNVRAVVLSGKGEVFCAGADLNWMKSLVGASQKDNQADALRLAELLTQIDCFPKPVIAQVHGAAIGGGVGLAAVSDIVIAAEGTSFGLSEVKLGLIPAVISPFVISKIGAAQARRYFLTGERFKADTALLLGLVHEVASAAGLVERVDVLAKELLSSGPEALKACKELIRTVSSSHQSADAIQQYTSKTIAALRVSPEGQEGMKAFLEKRKPAWLTR